MSDWRRTREYRLWRVAVIRRDGVCQVDGCNTRQNRHAHHIESGSYNLELRYVVENGITLCKDCHMNYHNNFNRSYRVKTTKYNFDNFITLMHYARNLFGS